MSGNADERDWGFSTLEVAGHRRFEIVYGKEATEETDPVAVSYRGGSLAHMATLVDLALAVLTPGSRVLDLGAHLGGFALTAAMLGCEVLAVEAAPRNAALLRLSAEHNHFDKLHVIEAAVTDESGSVEFSSAGPFGHLATPVTGLPTVSVPAVRVDDLLEKQGWDRVHFIKLDVEGSEIRAIRGMHRLLTGENPPLIYFESNKHTLNFYDQTDADLRNVFRQRGYVLYDVRPEGLRCVQDDDAQTETVKDYLAAKQLPPSLTAWKPKSPPSLLRRIGNRLGLTKRGT